VCEYRQQIVVCLHFDWDWLSLSDCRGAEQVCLIAGRVTVQWSAVGYKTCNAGPVSYDTHIKKKLFVCLVFGVTAPQWARASSFPRLLDHTQWRTTVGRILSTSYQLVAETSTWQHTTHTTYKHPCPRGIRTHDRSRRATADVRGQRNRPKRIFCDKMKRLNVYIQIYRFLPISLSIQRLYLLSPQFETPHSTPTSTARKSGRPKPQHSCGRKKWERLVTSGSKKVAPTVKYLFTEHWKLRYVTSNNPIYAHNNQIDALFILSLLN
jgi:hypothetical protein